MPETPVETAAAGGVDAARVNDALVTLKALQSLAQCKAFTGWFMDRLTARVAELDDKILNGGEIEAAEVMGLRLRRKEILHLKDSIAREHGQAVQVLGEKQRHDAKVKQQRETGPAMTDLPPPDFAAAAASSAPVSVEGIKKEFGEMFSIWNQAPAETLAAATEAKP